MDPEEHTAWGREDRFLVFTRWEPLRLWLALGPYAEWPDTAAARTTSYDHRLTDQP